MTDECKTIDPTAFGLFFVAVVSLPLALAGFFGYMGNEWNATIMAGVGSLLMVNGFFILLAALYAYKAGSNFGFVVFGLVSMGVFYRNHIPDLSDLVLPRKDAEDPDVHPADHRPCVHRQRLCYRDRCRVVLAVPRNRRHPQLHPHSVPGFRARRRAHPLCLIGGPQTPYRPPAGTSLFKCSQSPTLMKKEMKIKIGAYFMVIIMVVVVVTAAASALI